MRALACNPPTPPWSVSSQSSRRMVQGPLRFLYRSCNLLINDHRLGSPACSCGPGSNGARSRGQLLGLQPLQRVCPCDRLCWQDGARHSLHTFLCSYILLASGGKALVKLLSPWSLGRLRGTTGLSRWTPTFLWYLLKNSAGATPDTILYFFLWCQHCDWTSQ